jgi:hypothetical protein
LQSALDATVDRQDPAGIPILDACCGGSLFLETDSQRRPVHWAFDVLNGPPDLGAFHNGLSYVNFHAYALTGPSGILGLERVAPIPLPPAAGLLVGGVVVLGAIGRRRARKARGTAS